ncbi:MAG: hypothetical protein BWY74_02097 [Firmicutes bacterium ADurb.Bin419]|nr:MAG: hypothetical protein BWY74_02097 [Firmicutes bacterium ADurb.Bin419]
MKVIFFRAGKGKKISNDKTALRFMNMGFEKVLFFAFVFVFIALLLVQGALMSPSLRTFLVRNNGIDGRPLAQEEYLYREGAISVALLESESNENIKLLVNGDEIAVFNQNLITLSVKDGDVIEVDGSLSDSETEVEIISASENISGVEVGKKIKVNSNIEEISRISIKE